MKALPVLVVLAASSLAAQPPAGRDRDVSPAVADMRALWASSRDNVTAAAEQLPDSLFSFKPTPAVRSMGELFDHVANSQRLLCALVLDETPAPDVRSANRRDAIASLEASNAYCARAYAISDAAAMQPLGEASRRTWIATGLGQPRTRLHALGTNAWHDNEHYGNIVTYLRLNGLVPPSSQPRKD